MDDPTTAPPGSKGGASHDQHGRPPAAPAHRQRWRVIVPVVLACLAVALLIVVWLATSSPSYWAPLNASDPAVGQLAEQFESRVTTEATRVRPDSQPWTVEVTESQINAWLADRMPKWLANQGVERQTIESISGTMVRMTSDRVEWAAEFRLAGRRVIARLAYRPQPSENGPATLSLQRLYIGRLGVPAGWLIGQVAGRSSRSRRTAEIVEAIRSIDLTVRLESGRRLVVTGMELLDGRAMLTCRMESPAASAPSAR